MVSWSSREGFPRHRQAFRLGTKRAGIGSVLIQKVPSVLLVPMAPQIKTAGWARHDSVVSSPALFSLTRRLLLDGGAKGSAWRLWALLGFVVGREEDCDWLRVGTEGSWRSPYINGSLYPSCRRGSGVVRRRENLPYSVWNVESCRMVSGAPR